MHSLRSAVAFADGKGRLLVGQADLPLSVEALASTFGVDAPVSVAELIALLEMPGNFRPGQPLVSVNERGPDDDDGKWFLAVVFGAGLTGRMWVFWARDGEGDWQHKLITGVALVQPSNQLLASGGRRSLGYGAVLPAGTGLVHADNDDDGNWADTVVSLSPALPRRSWIATDPPGNWSDFFAVDASGTVQRFTQHTTFDPAAPMIGTPVSDPGVAPPSAPLAVDLRVPEVTETYPYTDVFVVDTKGDLWSFAKRTSLEDQSWVSTRMPKPADVVLLPGSFIVTGYQVHEDSNGNSEGYSQLDVFVVDAAGRLQVWWAGQEGDWSYMPMTNGDGLVPGGPLATGRQSYTMPWQNTPIGNQLDVFAVDASGALRRWYVYQTGNWTADVVPSSGPLPAGAHIATGYQGNDEDDDGIVHQLDVFVVGSDGRINIFWQSDKAPWQQAVMPGSDA